LSDIHLRRKLSYIEAWLSIIVNILLFAIKYWAGIVTGSIALIADAWHTLSDSVSSVVILVSTRISTKPADNEHPFGHGRIELIATIIIAVLLAMIGFNFLKESISKLIMRETVSFGAIAIAATVISIIFKEVLAQFALWAGKKAKSTILKADAWHHRSDAISSVIILAGIFLGNYFWWIDGVLGIIVTCFIFYAAYEILRDAINPLLGTQPDEDLVRDVQNICLKKGSDKIKPHHFHLHEYGHHKELTFHIEFIEQMSLDEAHTVANNIEETIRDELGLEATIHMEPRFSKTGSDSTWEDY
jgi:cation diffusion facilitator family transporter